ncbi:hypothetical protein MAR_008247 [Mya arenaria]|uniref:Reverse transcriptase domain-containing protein n=1 Tax=Mya arenaria TaxID=6604 RepID=A0ABY7DXF1_MYAAR|nr:hypothetical protein MAR_008247 [Mya arenaria]
MGKTMSYFEASRTKVLSLMFVDAIATPTYNKSSARASILISPQRLISGLNLRPLRCVSGCEDGGPVPEGRAGTGGRTSLTPHTMMKHLEHHNNLTNAQHGFCKQRSFETQLTIEDLAKEQTNAFDKVRHLRLLRKFDYYSIWGTSHN